MTTKRVYPKGRRGFRVRSGGVRIIKGKGTLERKAPKPFTPPRASDSRPRKYRVIVNAFERPHDVMRLLRDLRSAGPRYALRVHVYDDCSDADMSRVRAFCRAEGWAFASNAQRRGREGFASWVHEILCDHYRTMDPDELLILLQDDMRLCGRFFDLLGDWWAMLPERPSVLVPYQDRRFPYPQWTGRPSERVGAFTKLGWTDCCFVASRKALAPLVRNPPKIDPSRWLNDHSASSGLGSHVSHTYSRTGVSIFAASRSLIVHVGAHDSKMHPNERTKHPLVNLGFVDGQRMHDVLMRRPRVVASLASIPSREPLLARVVASLAPQVDQLNVYLNDYRSVPRFLQAENRCSIKVARSQNHGNLGDAGKFFFPETGDTYAFFCDDDIVYPYDYVQLLIREVERYGRGAIVSAHGSKLRNPLTSYFRDRVLYACLEDVARNHRVEVPGTGVMAVHASTIALHPKLFSTGFMADVHVAVAAHRAKVPIYVVSHAKGWLSELEAPTSLYRRFRDDDRRQTRALQEVLRR